MLARSGSGGRLAVDIVAIVRPVPTALSQLMWHPQMPSKIGTIPPHLNTACTANHPPHVIPFPLRLLPPPSLPPGEARDLGAAGILDLYTTKWWALKLASDSASTVLRIDQIIMAKMAGGPAPRKGGAADDED